MLSLSDQTILVLAPHPDDEIFGCGGLIHRCKCEGGRVYVLYMTVGTTKDFSQRGESTADERLQEIEAVAEMLKLDGWRMALPGNEYHLQLDAQAQKRLLDEIERGPDVSLQAVEPTIVLTPLPNDYNQDHRAVTHAVLTATRPGPQTFRSLPQLIMHYELPPNAWTSDGQQLERNVYVPMTADDLHVKTAALECYASQLKDPMSPISVHGVQSLAQQRGVEAGHPYAEAYVARRFLM